MTDGQPSTLVRVRENKAKSTSGVYVQISNSTTLLRRKLTLTLFISLVTSLAATFGCQSITDRQDVRPRALRDVPAQRLAYRLETDIVAPAEISADDTIDKLDPILADFNTRRPDDALIRTVTSPDKQRALALYGTEGEPSSAFRIDLYSSDGKFLRNLTPPTLSCVFPETVAWSPDGTYISFVAHRRVEPAPTPTPPVRDIEELAQASPSPSVAPAFPAVQAFNTEQIYICNRDGFDLKPLTAREGLIYFYFSWAPDAHALVALACKEPEWDQRERAFRLPTGRPRLISLDGTERLLDDELTEALPVWSSDAAKVATAFDTDVAIFDAASTKPTQARITLRDQLLNASIAYEQKAGAKKKDEKPAAGPPASFNPIVRLEWPNPERLYLQTAYVRMLPNETINTFPRWHLLQLSAQAAVLK